MSADLALWGEKKVPMEWTTTGLDPEAGRQSRINTRKEHNDTNSHCPQFSSWYMIHDDSCLLYCLFPGLFAVACVCCLPLIFDVKFRRLYKVPFCQSLNMVFSESLKKTMCLCCSKCLLTLASTSAWNRSCTPCLQRTVKRCAQNLALACGNCFSMSGIGFFSWCYAFVFIRHDSTRSASKPLPYQADDIKLNTPKPAGCLLWH